MKRLTALLLFFVCMRVCAADLDKTSLKHALESPKTPAEVQQAIKGLASVGAEKDKYLAKQIGADNLTYFMLTVQPDAMKGFDLRLKGDPKQRDMTILNRLAAKWNFISMDEVKRLTVGTKGGSFFVDNDCLRGTLVFEMDAKGAVTKLAIPRLNTKSMQGALVIFEKK